MIKGLSLLVSSFFLVVATGCASHSTKTVKTETVQHAAAKDPDSTKPAAVEKQTTEMTETTRTEGESVGILSGAVRTVGQVLALPFRAVGGLIGLMF